MHKIVKSESFEIIQDGGNFGETRTTETRKEEGENKINEKKKKLDEMISEKSASKNGIRRYISSIKSGFDIIQKLFSLKELYIFNNVEESEIEVAKLDKEIEEIAELVDVIIEAAETHLRNGLEQRELESIARSEDWSK